MVSLQLFAGFGPDCALKAACDPMKRDDAMRGEAVFPHQEFSRKEFPGQVAIASFEALPRPRVVYLIGCVDYRVVGGASHHQSQVVRALVGPDGIAPDTIAVLSAEPLTARSDFAEDADW